MNYELWIYQTRIRSKGLRFELIVICRVLWRTVNILLFSQGSRWSNYLRELLGKMFFIFIIAKSVIGFAEVVGDIDSLASDFSPSDHVVVLVGTNDDPSNNTIRSVLKKTCRSWKRQIFVYWQFHIGTTTCVATDWFSMPIVGFHDGGQKKIRNLRILDVNMYVNSSNYTRHGLYFLFNRKRQLCRVLAKEFLRDNQFLSCWRGLVDWSISLTYEIIGTFWKIFQSHFLWRF